MLIVSVTQVVPVGCALEERSRGKEIAGCVSASVIQVRCSSRDQVIEFATKISRMTMLGPSVSIQRRPNGAVSEFIVSNKVIRSLYQTSFSA